MFFSICIPVYNRKNTILRTLESIRIQRFSSYEVLIVDDGSYDGTGIVINKFILDNSLENNFHYIFKNNGGKHTALNIGIEKAKGVFFIILDSDDWFTDSALDDLYNICKMIELDDSFCGVMGKSRNYDTGKMIGEPFDLSKPVSSLYCQVIFPLK